MTDDSGRFERLLRILRQLAMSGGRTTRQLADLTGVDVRSIQRDILFLQDRCFDIVCERRRYYRLNKDFELPGQTLTLEEVLSLALGTAALSDQLGVLGQQALEKLQCFIKADKKVAVREFPSSLAFEPSDEGQQWMAELMLALSAHRTVCFHYNAPTASSDRRVDPYTLFYQDGRWYVQGYDHDRRDLRSFRLKRIESLCTTETTFQVPSNHNSQSALFHKWDIVAGPAVQARCRVSGPLARWLRENPVHGSQRVTDDVLELEVRDLDALACWLLSLNGVEALSPPALRTLLKEKARAAASLYD